MFTAGWARFVHDRNIVRRTMIVKRPMLHCTIIFRRRPLRGCATPNDRTLESLSLGRRKRRPREITRAAILPQYEPQQVLGDLVISGDTIFTSDSLTVIGHQFLSSPGAGEYRRQARPTASDITAVNAWSAV